MKIISNVAFLFFLVASGMGMANFADIEKNFSVKYYYLVILVLLFFSLLFYWMEDKFMRRRRGHKPDDIPPWAD